MPGTVAATTHSTAPAENWEKQLETYLRDAGSSNPETRKAAELRLAIFPHAQILMHLPRIWQREIRKHHRFKIALGIALGVAFVLILPVGGFLLYLKRQEGFQNYQTPLDLLRLFLMFVGQSGVMVLIGFRLFSKDIQPGAIYALIQHQCMELVPQLIEALSVPQPVSSTVDLRRQLVMAALTRLLPRFALADRSPLTRRQRNILTRELRQFNRALRNPLAALTPEEANFLSAVLNFLATKYRRNLGRNTLQPVTDLVEDLAVERAEYHQESAARTQVREAARAALVCLSA